MEDEAADKTAGVVAVVAGLIAAVKLSRVESRAVGSLGIGKHTIATTLSSWLAREASGLTLEVQTQ
jgi:hypothetical protein